VSISRPLRLGSEFSYANIAIRFAPKFVFDDFEIVTVGGRVKALAQYQAIGKENRNKE